MNNRLIEQEIIEMLMFLMEEKDVYTAGHCQRVAMYSTKIAEHLGFNQKEQTTLYYAGLLHDIGKITTPEAILLKPKKFSRHEFTLMKNHATDSEKMVSMFSSFQHYAPIIRHHHERFDGKGYPDGLSGENIPLLSRIMIIADAFDAMTTHRIYKARKTIAEAMCEIKKCAGSQFDPHLIESALHVFESLKELTLISQSPQSPIQEERFAYFFKDALTGVYSGDYLNYFLTKNRESNQFRCGCFVQTHHMRLYNERFGWSFGNDLLTKIAFRIKVLFHSPFVFRIFGDDFLVLNVLNTTLNQHELIHRLTHGFQEISFSIQHFDFEICDLENWESLEKFLMPTVKRLAYHP